MVPASAAIWKALLRLASWPGPFVLPPCMAGSDPKPLQEPLARGTPPSLTSTQPRGPHPSACLACGKGRIQDVAEQKLAGLLMPQDGDGEPQVVDLLGGGCSGWVAVAQGAQGKGRRSHL